MLRRYFVLVYPLAVAAAAGLTYLHFQQAARGQQGADGFVVAQEQPPAVQPPAVQPPARAERQPARRRTHHGRLVGGKRPENRDEIQTPFLRQLYDQLEGVEGGTDEERNSARNAILDADLELRDSTGHGALRRIREANRPRPAFRVEHARRLLKTPLTDPSPLTTHARGPQPRAELVDPAARPVNPAAPQPAPPQPRAPSGNDPFEKLFD